MTYLSHYTKFNIVIFVTILVALFSPYLNAIPILTHVSDPTPPGKACVIIGDGWIQSKPEIRVWRLEDGCSGEPSQTTIDMHENLGQIVDVLKQEQQTVTVQLPSGAFGIFALQAKGKDGWSKPFLINRARADWLYPKEGTPGGEMRIIGRNLVGLEYYPEWDARGEPVSYGGYVEGSSKVVLLSLDGGKFITTTVEKMSTYDLHFRLPKDLPLGEYKVYVHNGHGGEFGWSNALTLKVASSMSWPETIFNVRDCGAAGDGQTDDTGAIIQAIEKARVNGGGVVFFPPGYYFVKQTLVLPRRTVLRGQNRIRSWIVFPDGMTRQPMEGPHVGITGSGEFGIEELTVHGVYTRLLVAAPVKPGTFESARGVQDIDYTAPPVENVYIKNSRIFQDPTCRVHYRQKDPFIMNKNQMWNRFAAIALRGSNLEVTDNEVKGGGMHVCFLDSRYFRMANNLLHVGYWGNALKANFHSQRLTEKFIFEDNMITTVTDEIGNGHGLFEAIQDCYIARNTIKDYFFTGDNEVILYHSYFSRIVAKTISAQTDRIQFVKEDVANWYRKTIDPNNKGPKFRAPQWLSKEGLPLQGSLKGKEMVIIKGAGIGQSSLIKDNTEDTIILEKPLQIIPGANGLIAITEFPQYWRCLTIDNTIDKGSLGIMHWGNGFDSIIEGNKLFSTGGIYIWSLSDDSGTYANFGGNYFIQVLHNIVNGGPWKAPGGINVVTSKGSGGIDILDLAIRGNLLQNDGFVQIPVSGGKIDGAPENDCVGVVIENNSFQQSKEAILVGDGASVVIQNNQFKDVEQPIVKKGKRTGYF